MARLRRARSSQIHRIAIAGDDPDLRASLVSLFEREGHEVRTTGDAAGAVALVRDFRPHLTLLDDYLERGTGAEVVERIREFDALTQVLLVTGYATEQPARALLAALDIQGYHDKSDGPARLLVLADAALKHYRTLARLERQRAYLSHLAAAAPEIMKLQPPAELLHVALRNAVGLLRAAGGVVATVNSGLFVLGDFETESVALRGGEGRYADVRSLADLSPAIVSVIREGLEAPVPRWHESGGVIIPLEIRTGERGCMLIEAPELPADAVVPCQIYARQVVQALENVLLYERATVDPLTGSSNRGHGRQRLEEMLKLGRRTGTPTSVLLVDIDHFKAFNDHYGHAAGDLVLRRVAAELRARLRTTDVVARWGGEEFVIALPATDLAGAAVAAEKLRHAIAALAVPFENHSLGATISGGVAVAAPGELDIDEVLARADRALYRAKAAGRNQIHGPADDQQVGRHRARLRDLERDREQPLGRQPRAPEPLALGAHLPHPRAAGR